MRALDVIRILIGPAIGIDIINPAIKPAIDMVKILSNMNINVLVTDD